MKILAIDTSSIVASVAVLEDNKLVCEYNLNHKKNHSQKLMPMIKEVMHACDLKVNDIDLFSVALGPGSFTGIRIGVATIKTLCQSVNKQIVGISTLDGLAIGIGNFEGIVCPIIDANNNQAYSCLYKVSNGQITPISGYFADDIEVILNGVDKYNDKVIFNGDGIEAYRDRIIAKLGQRVNFADSCNNIQKASSIGQLAYQRYKENKLDDVLALSPVYLRKSQAERVLENKS